MNPQHTRRSNTRIRFQLRQRRDEKAAQNSPLHELPPTINTLVEIDDLAPNPTGHRPSFSACSLDKKREMPHVARTGRLPVARQLASQAAIDGNVDLPALKQMLHFVMQGMHSAAPDD